MTHEIPFGLISLAFDMMEVVKLRCTQWESCTLITKLLSLLTPPMPSTASTERTLWLMSLASALLRLILLSIPTEKTPISTFKVKQCLRRVVRYKEIHYPPASAPLVWVPSPTKWRMMSSAVRYVDNAAVIGNLDGLLDRWDKLLSEGPKFGYTPNPKKTWIIINDILQRRASDLFKDCGIQVTGEGWLYLESTIGSATFTSDYVKTNVERFNKELVTLATFGSQPHTAYIYAFTHGIPSKWCFSMCTTNSDCSAYEPLEHSIRHNLIPAITGRTFVLSLMMREKVFTLSVNMGGLAITNPTVASKSELVTSLMIIKPLVDHNLQQTLHTTNFYIPHI